MENSILPHMAPTSITLVKKDEGEILKIGPLTLRVQEDGGHTDHRIGAVTIYIPPQTPGPPQHWHQFHDETFLVLKGTVRFTTDDSHHDAQAGDYVVVPPRSHHTFGNPFDEPAELFCTLSPAMYVGYFRLIAEESKKGPISKDDYLQFMLRYATLPVK